MNFPDPSRVKEGENNPGILDRSIKLRPNRLPPINSPKSIHRVPMLLERPNSFSIGSSKVFPQILTYTPSISSPPQLYSPPPGNDSPFNTSDQVLNRDEEHRLLGKRQSRFLTSPRGDTLSTLFGEAEDCQLEDGLKSKVEFHKLLIFDMSTGLMSSIGAFFTIVTYDLQFDERDPRLLEILLWSNFVLTIFTIISNVFTRMQKINFLKARAVIDQHYNLLNSKSVWWLLGETFLLLIQPYPFARNIRADFGYTYQQQSYYYYVNDLFSLFIASRLYMIVRFALDSTIYRSPRSQRIAEMYGAKNNYMFACKCLVKRYPFKIVSISFLASVFVFTFMLRICERIASHGLEFNSYYDAMWCIVITMTTTGYGDFYPKTVLGQLVILLLSIWGVFVVSLIIVTLTGYLTMDSSEERVFQLGETIRYKKLVKNEAAGVIMSLSKFAMGKLKKSNASKKVRDGRKETEELRRHVKNFQAARANLRSVGGGHDLYEDMRNQSSSLKDEIKEISTHQRNLMKKILELKNLVDRET